MIFIALALAITEPHRLEYEHVSRVIFTTRREYTDPALVVVGWNPPPPYIDQRYVIIERRGPFMVKSRQKIRVDDFPVPEHRGGYQTVTVIVSTESHGVRVYRLKTRCICDY